MMLGATRLRLGLQAMLAAGVLAGGASLFEYRVEAQPNRRPVAPTAKPPAPKPTDNSAEVAPPGTVLMTRQWSPDGKSVAGTIWRIFETWRTDVARTAKGDLINVDPLTPRGGRNNKGELVRLLVNQPGWSYRESFAKLEIYPAKQVHGSPLPPEGWQAADFDDHDWVRDPYPQRNLYGAVALRCLRGKFEVTNPSQASDLDLTVRFRGGAVAYLNGKEVGRAFLPQGEVKPDTLAEDYPQEAYIGPEGVLIDQGIYHQGGDNRDPEYLRASQIEHGLLQWNGDWKWHSVSVDSANSSYFNGKDPQVVTRYKSRCRTLTVKIPKTLLRQGVNVLAIEIHRAPAWEGMFTSPCYAEGKKSLIAITTCEVLWDRSELEDVKLTAAGKAAGITPNVGPAKGLHVWNNPASVEVDPSYYGDRNEPLQPIQLHGLKNGTYSGQIVASSTNPIRGLNVQAADLKGPNNTTIPASAIQIGYARVADGFEGRSAKAPEQFAIFDVLEPKAPAEISAVAWSMGRTFPPVQPVWVTVRIPRDAASGTYEGKITVGAQGEKTVEVPLQLEVVGNWVLPDPTAFTTYVGFLECPDAVAQYYNVPLWSEKHWQLLDKIFEVLGQLGTKDLYIPLVAKTHLGNPYSMVRWIKQADGSYNVDTSIVERYLDLAIKHLGKVPLVCLYVSTRSQYGFEKAVDQPLVTELNPATGALTELKPPKWGAPESQAFWKPVIDKMHAIMAARGLDDSMRFGYLCDGPGPDAKGDAWGQPKHFMDLRAISPQTRWMVSTHIVPLSWHAGNLQGRDFLASLCWMFGLISDVHWMDDNDTDMWKPMYGWRDRLYPQVVVMGASRSRSPTTYGDHCLTVTRWRIAAESMLLSRKNEFTYQGMGTWGADFWGNEWRAYDPYGNVALSESTVLWMVGPGQAGPVPTGRTRMLQESLQEAETRIFVQNAILDADKKTRLSADLAQRCKEFCENRTRAFTYMSVYRYNDGETAMPRLRVIPDPAAWEADAVKMDRLADEVAQALGKP